MYTLELITNIPDGEELDVEMAGMHKTADSETEKLRFELAEGEHEIKIKQLYEPTYDKFWWWLFYVLTVPIRAAFNIIFLNTDDEKPDFFNATATATVNLNGSLRLKLNCNKTEDIQKSIAVSLEGIETKTEYEFNEDKLKDYLRNYIKHISSVMTAAVGLFSYLLFGFLKASNTVGTATAGATLTLLLGTYVFALCKKNKDVKAIRKKYKTE